MQNGLAAGPCCELSERVGEVFEQLWWCDLVCTGTQRAATSQPTGHLRTRAGALPAELDTAVLDGMFPVRFSLPTHVSPFLTLIVTTGTVSSSQLLTGINTVALTS